MWYPTLPAYQSMFGGAKHQSSHKGINTPPRPLGIPDDWEYNGSFWENPHIVDYAVDSKGDKVEPPKMDSLKPPFIINYKRKKNNRHNSFELG